MPVQSLSRSKGNQMQIEVVIPVVTGKEAETLLRSIENNTVLPNAVHVIDNTPDSDFSYRSSVIDVTVYHLSDTGLNFAWNAAKRSLFHKASICCFFNDDIEINKYYFENIIECFKDESVKVLCPTVMQELQHLKGGGLYAMSKRQGCCFAMTKEHLNNLPFIPTELKTFFGDDWWFFHKDVNWFRDDCNIITHKVGVGIKALDKRKDLRKERSIFSNLINNKT